MGLWVHWFRYSGESRFVGEFIVDIPQLAVDGIEVGDECFVCVYSMQSSSKNLVWSSWFDANGLESVIRRESRFVV